MEKNLIIHEASIMAFVAGEGVHNRDCELTFCAVNANEYYALSEYVGTLNTIAAPGLSSLMPIGSGAWVGQFAIGFWVNFCNTVNNSVQIGLGFPRHLNTPGEPVIDSNYPRDNSSSTSIIQIILSNSGASLSLTGSLHNDQSTANSVMFNTGTGLNNSAALTWTTSSQATVNDVWHHVGVGIDSTGSFADIKLYWNGVLRATQNFGTGTGTNPFWDTGTPARNSWVLKSWHNKSHIPYLHNGVLHTWDGPIMGIFLNRSQITNLTYWRSSIPDFSSLVRDDTFYDIIPGRRAFLAVDDPRLHLL